MKQLRGTLEEYLTLRRALGFKLERDERHLSSFIDHLDRHHAPTVTTALARSWAMQPPSASPRWWAMKLSVVRSFARYLQTLDPRTEIPPMDLLSTPRARRLTAYLYSEQDIVRLLAAARQLPSPIMAATYSTLIGLLAVTGMRVGEAIALERRDVDWSHRLLLVRHGKFGKSRQVVLHSTTMEALDAYVRLCERSIVRPQAPTFFLSSVGTRLIYNNVHRNFRRLVRSAELEPRFDCGPPRLHDLRHTFAIRTLQRWLGQEVDVQARLPRLSTYLGHVSPDSTYWYLSAVPELMAAAGSRLEKQLEARP